MVFLNTLKLNLFIHLFICDHCLKEGEVSSTLFAYNMTNFSVRGLFKAY